MNYDNIINKTKDIETILVNLGAEGKGLHEKVSSIKDINKQVVKSIRFIATIRNNALHDESFTLTENILEEFNDAYEVAVTMLPTPENHQPIQKKVKKIELSRFEKDILLKSEVGYMDCNDTKARGEFCDNNWRYCPNCEDDTPIPKGKFDINGNNYLIKYCLDCDYVFSSKRLGD